MGMFKKQTFEDNIYMRLVHYCYIFLAINIALLLLNLPFFFASSLLALDSQNVVFFLVALFPFGLSILAVFAVIDEFKSNKEVEPFRAYFRYVKKYWRCGSVYWLLNLFCSLVGIGDSIFFAHIPNGQWLIPFFILLVVLSWGFTLLLYYFKVRNPEASHKDLWRVALYYLLKKWYFTVLNVILAGLILILMILKPQFGFLLTPSILLGLIYLNCSHLHRLKLKESTSV